MKIILSYLTILVFILSFNSCELVTDYKFNSDIAHDMSLLEYIDMGKDPRLTLFAEAVRFAELEDEFTRTNNKMTRLIPDNDAFQVLLSNAGVQNITDIPKDIWRNLLLYCLFSGNTKSYELEKGEIRGYIAENGDSIYLKRETSTTDDYILYVNKVSSMRDGVLVTRQDYIFPEGVAHIVSSFPLPTKPINSTDPIPSDFDYSEAKRDTIWVQSDAHLYQGNAATTYHYDKVNLVVSRSNVLRYTFLKFTMPESVGVNPSLAFININILDVKGTNWSPNLAFYDAPTNWPVDATFTWHNYANQITVRELITSYQFSSTYRGWLKVNVTQHISNVLSVKQPGDTIGIGIKLLNGEEVPSSMIYMGWLNEPTGEDNQMSYLELLSKLDLVSELTLENLSPLISNGNKVTLTTANILMKAPISNYPGVVYTDNNILYKLEELPKHGYIIRNGIPMTLQSSFTQEELKQGAIKYIPMNGVKQSDTFKLLIQDYLGGNYKDIIKIAVE